MITPPIPQPFKGEHMLWLHLSQPDSLSSWLRKRAKKSYIKQQKGTNPKISTLLLVLALNVTAVIIPGKTTQQLSSSSDDKLPAAGWDRSTLPLSAQWSKPCEILDNCD